MTVESTANVVAGRHIDNALDYFPQVSSPMVSLNPSAYLLLTVEVAHTKNPGGLHQRCKRIDDTVVVCNQLVNNLSKRIEIN